MRKKSMFSFILFASLFCIGCENKEGIDSIEEYSKVMVDLGLDVSYPTSKRTQSKALDLSQYSDITNYTVELIDQKNQNLIFSKLYGEMDLKQEIASGSYLIRAFYGENVIAGFDKMYVEGWETFTVDKGEEKTISFVCVPANVKINIRYSDDFFEYYSDCTVGLKTKFMTSPFLMSIEDAGKDLYVKASQESEELVVTFDLKDKDGTPVNLKDFGPHTIQVKPRDFLTITVKPKLVELEGGRINGIAVLVDDGVTEEDMDFVVPDEFLPGEGIDVNN